MEERTMKRIILVTAVLVLASGAVFARGSMESDFGPENGQRNGTGRNAGIEQEVAGLTGTLLEKDGWVVRETADGTYSISARGYMRNPLDLPFGETVTVSGTMVDSEDCPVEDCEIEADGHIFVESASGSSGTFSFDAGRSGGRTDTYGGRYAQADNRGMGRGMAQAGSDGGRNARSSMGSRGSRGGMMDGSGYRWDD